MVDGQKFERVVGYARVSSKEQAVDHSALKQQINRLERAGANEIFQDEEAGTRDDRIQFNQMLEQIEARKIDKVIITRLDRLSRRLPTILSTVDLFVNNNCQLYILDMSVDTSTPTGRFFLNILGCLAELEVDMLGERIRHGWDYRKLMRKATNPPFGYTVVEDSYVLNHAPYKGTGKSCVEIAREIIELYLECRSRSEVIQLMNLQYGPTEKSGRSGSDRPDSFTGLAEYLKNPVLQGHTVYFDRVSKKVRQKKSVRRTSTRTIITDTHPDQILISESEAEEIAQALSERTPKFGNNEAKFPISGLVYCAICGGRMYVNAGYKDYRYYRCSNRLKGLCEAKLARMDRIESVLEQVLTQKGEAIAARIHGQMQLPVDDVSQDIQLQEMHSSLRQLESIQPSNPAIQEAIEKMKATISNREFSLSKPKESDLKKTRFIAALISQPQWWQSEMDLSTKRLIYATLIHKILIDDGRVSLIRFNFAIGEERFNV